MLARAPVLPLHLIRAIREVHDQLERVDGYLRKGTTYVPDDETRRAVDALNAVRAAINPLELALLEAGATQ